MTTERPTWNDGCVDDRVDLYKRVRDQEEETRRIEQIRAEKRAARAVWRESEYFRNRHIVILTPWAAAVLSREDYSRVLHIARGASVQVSLSADNPRGPFRAHVTGNHRAIAPTPAEAAFRAFQLAGIGEAE